MSYSTNKSAELLYEDQSDSQSVDEGSYSGSFSAGEPFLKKGPWTSGEDAILVDYVKKHGEGNWNAVQKHSGLFRCGKSCRLRWANHLRPNLKKGTFTADEERLIVELHAQMGNKWARMAARLPGRTDNEIKNYWNTRIKRMQRAGLPLYPPEMCLQTMNGSQNTQKNNEFNNYDVPDVSFDGLKTNHGGLSYVTNLPDISVRTILSYGQNSYLKHSVPTTIHHPKRAREQENIFPGFNGNFTGGISPFDQLQSDSGTKIHRSLALSIPYNPESKIKNYSPFGATTGCHAFLNGNISTSMPISGTVKLELPSFQYPETDLGSWGKSPLLPSLKSVETFTQTSLLSEQANTECLSPRNSGLLDALLHESQTLNSAKNQSSEKSLSSSIVTQSDIMGSSTLNLCHTEWEDWFDPTSPFGPSATSSLGSCTPIRGSSSDKPLSSSESLPAAGSNTKQETIEPISTLDGGKTKISTQIDFSRPDALLGAGWFEYNIGYAKNHNIKTETTGTLLSEDICNNYRHMMGGISTVR